MVNLGQYEKELSRDSMIVSETDERGRIIYANNDFCEMAEYTKDELIGKSHNIVRHPFMPGVAFQGLWDTIKKGEIWNGIVVNKTKNGGYYWVNATVFQSFDHEGNRRYYSVRVKPTEQEIANAMALYPTLG
jgi:aerotaxis receptor